MDLPRPNAITFAAGEFVIFTDCEYNYEDPDLNITQHINVCIAFFSDDTGKATMTNCQKIPDDTLLAWTSFKARLDTCSNNAEHVNGSFLSITRVLFATSSEDWLRPINLDFMGLKDKLMRYVKGDPTSRHLADKKFRRELDNFINYRNIFIHGKLCLIFGSGGVLPDQYVIRYIDKSPTLSASIRVDKKLVKKYINTYRQIIVFINEFKKIKNLP